MNFTFKKEKCETGLAGIGHPYPDVQIKHKKKQIGTIHAPAWNTVNNEWCVRFMLEGNDKNPNASWHWAKIKVRFDSEETARQWVKDNAEKILALNLHSEKLDD